MKLLVFSDLHSDRAALARLMEQEADLYLCAGDLVNWARGLEAMGDLMRPKADRMLVIPGNHESPADIAAFCQQYGFVNLHGQTRQFLTAAGPVWLGALGCSNPTPFQTPGEYTEAQLAEHLAPMASLSPLVLVCHCPPKQTPLDRAGEGKHFGSTAIADFLSQHQPALFFSGHIHESQGAECRLGQTIGRNPGKKGYLVDLAAVAAGHAEQA